MTRRLLSLLLAIAVIMSSMVFVPTVATAQSKEVETTLSSVALTDWMSAIKDSTKLTEITIPGTHDSCARKFKGEDAFGVMSGISKCQSLNIIEQLNSGARFLDVRCEVDASNYSVKTVHGSTDCWNGDDYYYLDYVLQDVYNWLAAHPSETVLISIKEDDGDVGAPAFTEAVYQYIHGYGQNKYFYGESYDYTKCWYLGKSVPALSDVRGKCVLMNRFDQYIDTSGSSVSENESGQKIKWGDQGGSDYVSPVYTNYYNNNTGVGNFHVQDHYEWSTSNKLSATQDMLSLGHYRGEYYINFTSTTTGATIPNPQNYANTINAGFVNLNFTKNKPAGIFPMDFINTDCARKLVENNEAVSTVVTGTDGNISYNINRLTGTLTISGSGSMKNYQFSTSNGANGAGSTAPWSDQIKNSVFDGQYNTDLITKIVVNEGVSSIGDYAFYGFDNVMEISLPNSIRSIGEGGFTKCAKILSLDVSTTNISAIGYAAFKDCTSLSKFVTSDKITAIGESAFLNDIALTMYGSSSVFSETYASDNNIKYIITGAYDADTDWFTSKATYYEPFTSQLNGDAVTNSVDNGNSVSWKEANDGRSGVAFIPWSIDRQGQNYIDTKISPFDGKDVSNGVTINFFKEIAGNYFDGAALTLAQSADNYFVIYDNGKIYYNNGTTSLTYNTESPDNTNKVWQYFSVTITESTVSLYVNGILNSQFDNTAGNSLLSFLSSSDTVIYPGSYNSRGTCSLYLDEIMTLDFAVNAEEAKAMYYSYSKPKILSEAQCATDANITVKASNGYENVIYTHGENTLTKDGVKHAADYMFKGDLISDGNNDGAYVYSTTAAGQENELSTSLSVNSKYTVSSITDNYGNNISFTKTSSTSLNETYLLSGVLSNGYVDGTTDDITLNIVVTDGTNAYTNKKYVHIVQHPVSANASSAIYRKWASGTSTKTRDIGVFAKLVGSTGKASTYYSGNYSYVSTPVYIGNGWNFASNTNADTFFMVGDGKMGDDLSDSFPSTSGLDIVNAGTYSQSNNSSSSGAQTVVAEGTTANYYIDKSAVSAGSTVGGITIENDFNGYSISTIVTRLSPLSKGTEYYFTSETGLSSSNGMSIDTSQFTDENAEAIGTSGLNNNGGTASFGFISPKIKGTLSSGSMQTAIFTAGIYHNSTDYTAVDKIAINVNVYDKSVLRNLVKEYESKSINGKGASEENWKAYQLALKNAYDNLNDYQDTNIISSTDNVYTTLVSTYNAIASVDKSAHSKAINYAKGLLNSDKVYLSSVLDPIVDSINMQVNDQTNIDIMTGKIYFFSRFIDTLDWSADIDAINTAKSQRADIVQYDQNKINSLVEEFYDDMKKTCTIDGIEYNYYSYYTQVSLDILAQNTVSGIENAIMNYSVTTNGGNVVKAQSNPFAGADISKGVTISFKKYCENDGDWNASLINFSSGNKSDNRYFIIMTNGTILFNDGNGGIGSNNNCYFDIRKSTSTNKSDANWYNIDITISKNSNGNHILKYYINKSLVSNINISSISANGYPNGISGNDGIFSFLSSNDINLYYGASFTNYGSMAGTSESYLDDVNFFAYAKSELQLTSEGGTAKDSEALYQNNFASSLGGTEITGNADGGNYVNNQQTDNDGRIGTAYFPWSNIGAAGINYVNTGTNPFVGQQTSNGLTISFYQRINGNYYGDRVSMTFAQGDTGQNKYFTIGTDGYIRYNNGNGGSDSSLSNAGLYFDYAETNNSIVTKTWQYITLQIIDDYNFKIYINGVLSKEITVTGTDQYKSTGGLLDFLTSTDTTMYFGSYTPYWGTCTLSLDDVRCYGSALSDSQVKSIYDYEIGTVEEPIMNESFEQDIPTKVNGSCKWLDNYKGQTGVLFIPDDSANGNISYYVNGNETAKVSSVPYGSQVKVVYNGLGNVIDWSADVSNADGNESLSSDEDTLLFTVTGNTEIAYNTILSADFSAFETALEDANIARASTDYVADDVINLSDTISSLSYATYTDRQKQLTDRAMQPSIESQTEQLMTAIESLRVAGDDDAYIALDEVISTIQREKYTTDGLAKLDDAVNKATSVAYKTVNGVKNKNQTQTGYDDLVASLLTTINELNADDSNKLVSEYTVTFITEYEDVATGNISTSSLTSTHKFGEVVSLTAENINGYVSGSWTEKNGSSSFKLKPQSNAIELVVQQNTTVIAHYINAPQMEEETYYSVKVLDKSGSIAGIAYVKQGDTIAANGNIITIGAKEVTATAVAFYDFECWNVYSVKNEPLTQLSSTYTVNDNVVIKPSFILSDTSDLKLFVLDNELKSMTTSFDTYITLNANNDNDFICWVRQLCSLDGTVDSNVDKELVSFNSKYGFYASKNYKYIAVYESTDLSDKSFDSIRTSINSGHPTASGSATYNSDTNRFTYYAAYTEGVDTSKITVEDFGAVYTTDASAGQTDFEIGQTNIKKLSFSQLMTNPYGEKLSCSSVSSTIKSGKSLYLRSYVTYTYSYNGAKITVTSFGPIESASNNA